MEYGADESEQWLSERARALLHTVTTWVTHLPEGTVQVSRALFPLDEDYGSESSSPCNHKSHAPVR